MTYGTLKPLDQIDRARMEEAPMVPTSDGHRGGAAQTDPSFSVVAPNVELPKGGGAIRGIGEKFAANPVTGTGQ